MVGSKTNAFTEFFMRHLSYTLCRPDTVLCSEVVIVTQTRHCPQGPKVGGGRMDTSTPEETKLAHQREKPRAMSTEEEGRMEESER